MEMARVVLSKVIEAAPVSKPICPVYQNVDAKPHTDPVEIKENLLKQLTSPVRWTQSVINMIGDGMTEFVECGPRPGFNRLDRSNPEKHGEVTWYRKILK